jgi:hypothetical protein
MNALLGSAAALPVALYVAVQRTRLRRKGTPLDPAARANLAPYFDSSDLDRVRVYVRDALPVFDPPFASALRRLGFSFLCAREVSAITYSDLIAARGAMPAHLLFHELVHVVQFRVLGLIRFSRLYCQGFLLTRAYERIPLECCAYELERRYCTEAQGFDVESEVRAWIARGLF